MNHYKGSVGSATAPGLRGNGITGPTQYKPKSSPRLGEQHNGNILKDDPN